MRWIILVLLMLAAPVLARNNGQWRELPDDVREWLRSQKIPAGKGAGHPCCSEADGEEVQEDIRGGRYWIKGGAFADWTVVPEHAIIRGPNKYGQPVVWQSPSGWIPVIYCYAPGALM